MATNISGSDGWKECAAWLTRCGVIRQDHKANWQNSTVVELAYTLRDGVLLCGLLNCLDPGCVDMKDVNQKPQMAQFLCLRNIKTFLVSCENIFDLRKTDLFEPEELFDLTNFLGVLQTLSILSMCPRVKHRNIEGFSIVSQNSESEEDIYKSLNSSEGPEQETKAEAEYSTYNDYSQTSEDIYQDLCIKKNTELPQWLNAAEFRHSLEKRDYVIKELVETEKNYLDVLNTVYKNFMRPLTPSLKEEEAAVIFSSMKELGDVHAGFHSQLRKAVSYGPASGGRLGEVFIAWKEHFLIYGDYCANLPAAQAMLNDVCMKRELFNQEVLKCEDEANQGKFKLRDILSVPMQRILKYHLLLDKLLQETAQTHEDYKSLVQARDAMVDVAQYINEVKRDSDTLQIIRDIQNSISDWNMPENMELKDYGRLLKDGEIRIKAHDDMKIRLRYVFIFDQVMLMCKATRSDQYRFRDSIRLGEYKVEDPNSRKTMNSGSRWSYQWFLIRKTERTAFTMYARTEELKIKWIKALQKAMDNIEPTGSQDTDHRFAMHTFDKPHTCHLCNKFLKGRIFQGYRCDQCLLAVHKSCIPLVGRCGGPLHRAPPELPPRPLNLWQQEMLPEPPQQRILYPPLLPSPPVVPERGSINLDWNEREEALGEYLWFMGDMKREDATALLTHERDGTYLLRVRPQGPTSTYETIYALSLKTESRVKHMKVYERELDGESHFYLSESRHFRSLEELVRFYEHTSLGENFVGLNVTLQWPYRCIPAVAKYDFEPTEISQLALHRGMHLYITSKEGDHKGWWKGRCEDRVGFFPKQYVEEKENGSP